MRRPLVLFDLDDTLVDRRGQLADWAAGFTTRRSLGVEAQAYVLGAVAERAYPSTFDVIRTRYRLHVPTGGLWWACCADIAAMVTCPVEVLGGLDALRAAGWRAGAATKWCHGHSVGQAEGHGHRRPCGRRSRLRGSRRAQT